tara:strand:- start:136 stop:312 length:177 start_codon:yes stop_codon:yes gene_type:complete
MRYLRTLQNRAKNIGMYVTDNSNGFFGLGKKTNMGSFEFIFKTLEAVEAELVKREGGK